jgi:microcin C transport system permease protein
MLSYIIRRLILMVPTLIGITMVVFSVMALAPGGLAASLEAQEQGMRPEEAQALREYYNTQYGLNDPLPVQYMRWLNNISPIGMTRDADGNYDAFGFKKPDMGMSFVRNQPVLSIVGDTLPITVLLNLIALPIIYGVAITTGIFAARHRGKWFDITTGTTFLALWSLPVMWVGVMLIGFLASKDYLHWFPTGGLHDTRADQMAFLPGTVNGQFQVGYLLDAIWHLMLPVFCMVIGGFAFLSKLMRASVLENLAADYVRTGRAKGLPDNVVLFQHVLRNSLLPLITVAASLLPALLGGSLIVERIFSIQGMGNLMIEAINQRDREIVLSVTFVISAIGLLSLIIRDVCYAIADPRVSFE